MINVDKIDELISKLDGASGRLIVTAMSGNQEVMEAMEMINAVNIELGEMFEDYN